MADSSSVEPATVDLEVGIRSRSGSATSAGPEPELNGRAGKEVNASPRDEVRTSPTLSASSHQSFMAFELDGPIVRHESKAFPQRGAPFVWKTLPQSLLSYSRESVSFYRRYPECLKSEILSGITVAIMQIPESVAFSFVAGLHPLQGLYASAFLAFFTGLLGGCPGMISGAAGALAVIVTKLMADSGPFGDRCLTERREIVFLVIIFTGMIQMFAGMLGIARFVRLVPSSAMFGFLNGLALVIFSAQFHSFKVPTGSGGAQVAGTNATTRLVTHGSATGCQPVDFGDQDDQSYMQFGSAQLWLTLAVMCVVMIIVHFLPKWTTRYRVGKYFIQPGTIVPATLVGLLVATGIEWGINRPLLDTPLKVVGDVASLSGALPPFHIPDVSLDWSSFGIMLQYAASLAAVGIIESVLTLQVVADIKDEVATTHDCNQESWAQGVANFVSGFFMSMGGDAMIGQSTINVTNGARGRLSAMTSGVMMLLIIVLVSPAIEKVPVAGLTGVMMMVVVYTFSWRSLRMMAKRELALSESVAVVLVTLLAVFTDLAIAVTAGAAFASLSYAWSTGTKLQANVYTIPSVVSEDPLEAKAHKRVDRKVYEFVGPLFFGSARDFVDTFTPKADPDEVVVDLAHTSIEDFSAVEALAQAWKRYEEVDDVAVALEHHLYRRPKRLYVQNASPACTAVLEANRINLPPQLRVIRPHRYTRHFHHAYGHGRPRTVSETDRELAYINARASAEARPLLSTEAEAVRLGTVREEDSVSESSTRPPSRAHDDTEGATAHRAADLQAPAN